MNHRYILFEIDSRENRVIRDIVKPSLPNLDDTEIKSVYNNFKHATGLLRNSDVPLIPYFAELAFYQLDFGEKGVKNTKQMNFLKDFIQYAKATDGILQNINGMTFNQIYNTYKIDVKEYFKNLNQGNKENGTKNDVINSKYTIIDEIDYEDANEIGEYTGENGEGPLCYTQDEYTWDSYTDDGVNTVYCLLRNDWKTVPCEHTEQILLNNDGSPVYSNANAYDSYGLSVIFVFINPDGEIATSNTRWNHKATTRVDDVDKAFSEADLERILNVQFDSIFKYTGEESNASKNYYSVKYFQKLLDSGMDETEVFGKRALSKMCDTKYKMICFDNSFYNFLYDGKIIFNRFYSYIRRLGEGFYGVYDGENYAIFNLSDNIEQITDFKFRDVINYEEGHIKVSFYVNFVIKYNFIDTHGNFLLKQNLEYSDSKLSYCQNKLLCSSDLSGVINVNNEEILPKPNYCERYIVNNFCIRKYNDADRTFYIYDSNGNLLFNRSFKDYMYAGNYYGLCDKISEVFHDINDIKPVWIVDTEYKKREYSYGYFLTLIYVICTDYNIYCYNIYTKELFLYEKHNSSNNEKINEALNKFNDLLDRMNYKGSKIIL